MRCFFDTNVLVYIFDERAPEKGAVARQLLADCITRKDACLSAQVLQEFFVTVTRKLTTPLTQVQAERAVRDFSTLPIVNSDAALVLDAITTSDRYRISFWDSLIVEAALRAGAAILYTEDLQDGQVFGSVAVENPFREIIG
jgi:predicted nucleic acid-binding protein